MNSDFCAAVVIIVGPFVVLAICWAAANISGACAEQERGEGGE